MPAQSYPLVEAFLVIEQPRQRLGHWSGALAALDSAMAPPLASVSAYYDPTSDQALVNLRYDDIALGTSGLSFIVEVALLAEIGMIQPAELSDGERKRFINERLARCTFQVVGQRSVLGALAELVKTIRDRRSVRAPRAAERGDTEDPVLLVPAKGTRDDLGTVAKLAEGSSPRGDTDVAARTTSRHIIPRSQRMQTVEMSPEEAERLASEVGDEEEDADGLPPLPPRDVPQTILARYLRSGRWVAVRIGALSLKGGALMTNALPRLHDHVDIALSWGPHRALVRGTVGKVSTEREAAATGAATFSVSFQLDVNARRQLTQLLTAARAANVTIKPPPARATRRFPVEWPVCLGTIRGAIRAEALDVSVAGMFVRPAVALQLGTFLSFSAVLDDGSSPIAGRAKVIRQITDAEASSAGLCAGYGLTVVEMSEVDRARWLAFLARIERRADKRVLIGASPRRLAELQAGLAAAGYAVTGGTDPGALVQLANADARPVDAALIDAGWVQEDTGLEKLFTARKVPCVKLQGDARRARNAIDRLLDVTSDRG